MSAFIQPDLDDPRLRDDRSYRMLIGGKSVDARSGKVIERASPRHAGCVTGRWPEASVEDMRAAISAARDAFDHGPWPRMTGAEHSAILFSMADRMLGNLDRLALAECLESGKPIEQAKGEVRYCADLWRCAASALRGLDGQTHNDIGANKLSLVLREPVGVVGIITPCNIPLIIASERVPWAIGVGRTAVLKPSELTAGTSVIVADLAREAGLPDGVFNVVTDYGEPAGQILAEAPRRALLCQQRHRQRRGTADWRLREKRSGARTEPFGLRRVFAIQRAAYLARYAREMVCRLGGSWRRQELPAGRHWSDKSTKKTGGQNQCIETT